MSTTRRARVKRVSGHPGRRRLWSVAGAMTLAAGVACSGLGAVLAGGAWWLSIIAVVVVVLAAATVYRAAGGRAWVGSVIGVGAGVAVLTLMFAADTAIVGIVPTGQTGTRFVELVAAGQDSITTQRYPAEAVSGIVAIVCLGAFAMVVAMDIAAFVLRRPALVGIPLLVLLIVPSIVQSELHDAFIFAATAVAYVVILLAASPRKAQRFAWPLAAASLAFALVTPLILPSIEPAEQPGTLPGLISTGLNPIINLSSDLRRNAPLLALTYTAEDGQYLRVAALDDFGDDTWQPSERVDAPENSVDAFGAPAGLSAAVPRSEAIMQISIERIRGKLLPVPYAATSIVGLHGEWSWEPEGLTVATGGSNSRSQEYEVSFVSPAPSIEQLEAAPAVLLEGFDKYLLLPSTLPDVVRETAQQVAGAEATQFDQALALQSFFRDGDFVYSEESPITDGYDGSGAGVLAEFLSAKSGYCIHFASAMAAMARSLDIPARVVVGFTPGLRQADAETGEIRHVVSTDNLHAWPELFFPTIGWIRFEPTVSVGSVPRFAPSVTDDPNTPDIDESQPESDPTPTASVAPGVGRDIPIDEQSGAPVVGVGPASVWWWSLLAVPLLGFVPALVRAVRRELRLSTVSRGDAVAAWRELCDTASDLRFAVNTTATPRQQFEQIVLRMGGSGSSALAAVLAAVETSAFGGRENRVNRQTVSNALSSLRASVGWKYRVIAAIMPHTAFSRKSPASTVVRVRQG